MEEFCGVVDKLGECQPTDENFLLQIFSQSWNVAKKNQPFQNFFQKKVFFKQKFKNMRQISHTIPKENILIQIHACKDNFEERQSTFIDAGD